MVRTVEPLTRLTEHLRISFKCVDCQLPWKHIKIQSLVAWTKTYDLILTHSPWLVYRSSKGCDSATAWPLVIHIHDCRPALVEAEVSGDGQFIYCTLLLHQFTTKLNLLFYLTCCKVRAFLCPYRFLLKSKFILDVFDFLLLL